MSEEEEPEVSVDVTVTVEPRTRVEQQALERKARVLVPDDDGDLVERDA